MPMVTNTAPRPIHLAGILLRPGTPAQVPDDAMAGIVVKALLKDGTLTVDATPEQADETVQQKAAEAAQTNAASAAPTVPKPAAPQAEAPKAAAPKA